MTTNADLILDEIAAEMTADEFVEFLAHVDAQGREAGFAADVIEAAQGRLEVAEMLS